MSKDLWVVGYHVDMVPEDDEDYEDRQELEVFITKKSNTQAFRSYGWDDDDKRIVFDQGTDVDEERLAYCLKQAQAMAYGLNFLDFNHQGVVEIVTGMVHLYVGVDT